MQPYEKDAGNYMIRGPVENELDSLDVVATTEFEGAEGWARCAAMTSIGTPERGDVS